MLPTRRFILKAAPALLLPWRVLGADGSRWRYSITAFDDGSSGGWLPGFADYSPATASTNRIAELRDLPEAVRGGGRRAYYLQGRNTSDDLFMFLKKPITNLQPMQAYDVSFYVELASNAPSNCVGIGGPPGEGVTLKAGASAAEPVALLQDNDIRLNIDKGNQSNAGSDALLMGNIANGIPCGDATGEYVLLRRSAAMSRAVKADLSGSLWVYVGTDSGFEGTTGVYYAFIAVLLAVAD